MSCGVVHCGQLSTGFEGGTGVRQGCLLSPFMFLLAIDWIMKATTKEKSNGIQWTLWSQLEDLDYADDFALLSHSRAQMEDKTTRLADISSGVGLRINKDKSKVVRINTKDVRPVTVGGHPLEEVDSFIYLGSIVDKQGGTDLEIGARIGKVRAAFIMLKNI